MLMPEVQLDLECEVPELHVKSPLDTVTAKEANEVARAMSAAGAGVLWRKLSQVFEQMQWAEEEIKAAEQQHMECWARVHDAFRYLAWKLMVGPCERIYRTHVREIIERVIAGEDLRRGTWAEVLATLSEASLEAPLNQTGLAAMVQAFGKVYSDSRLATPVMEPYPGAAAELVGKLRVKLACERDARKVIASSPRRLHKVLAHA